MLQNVQDTPLPLPVLLTANFVTKIIFKSYVLFAFLITDESFDRYSVAKTTMSSVILMSAMPLNAVRKKSNQGI